MMALFSAIFPMIFGFILGNISTIARKFLEAGEKLIIPFAAFAIGASINLQVLVGEGSVGILLGLATAVFSGGAAIASLYVWHIVRSEEHTSELQSLMRISYAVFCLKKKKTQLKY